MRWDTIANEREEMQWQCMSGNDNVQWQGMILNGMDLVLTHESIPWSDMAIGVENRVDCYRSPSISPDLIVRVEV